MAKKPMPAEIKVTELESYLCDRIWEDFIEEMAGNMSDSRHQYQIHVPMEKFHVWDMNGTHHGNWREFVKKLDSDPSLTGVFRVWKGANPISATVSHCGNFQSLHTFHSLYDVVPAKNVISDPDGWPNGHGFQFIL